MEAERDRRRFGNRTGLRTGQQMGDQRRVVIDLVPLQDLERIGWSRYMAGAVETDNAVSCGENATEPPMNMR